MTKLDDRVLDFFFSLQNTKIVSYAPMNDYYWGISCARAITADCELICVYAPSDSKLYNLFVTPVLYLMDFGSKNVENKIVLEGSSPLEAQFIFERSKNRDRLSLTAKYINWEIASKRCLNFPIVVSYVI